MAGAERQVQEEGALTPTDLVIAHHADRLVNKVLGQVVAGLGIEVDRVVVDVQLGVVLVGQRTMKPVPTVEALAQRPVCKGACGTVFLGTRQVPLAHGQRVVTLATQDLGQSARRGMNAAVVARHAVGPLGDDAHSHGVGVATRE